MYTLKVTRLEIIILATSNQKPCQHILSNYSDRIVYRLQVTSVLALGSHR